MVKIDIGCGSAKQPDHIGLDYVKAPGVDHVLDLTKDKYPFEDRSVDEVFSAHFFEHIKTPNHVLSEIGRISKNGAKITIWTPYAHSSDAFLYGHETYLTERPWINFCVTHRESFKKILNGYWELNAVTFLVLPHVQEEMKKQNIPLEFAVRHLNNVVHEFCVEMTYKTTGREEPVRPEYFYCPARDGEKSLINLS
jgi:predicted SAM-dependent methyltransferase